MTLKLYSHPFSAYSHKVLIALWENEITFDYRNVEDAGAMEELAGLWPMRKFPILVDDGETIVESSIIIEYLDLKHPGPVRFIPDGNALEVRLMDRFFDNYVNSATYGAVVEAMKGKEGRTEEALANARVALDVAYAWLEGRLSNRTWAAGDDFTMADCAAAPSLFYADWVHEIAPSFRRLRDYRAQLLHRPSFARAVEEARPYRSYFPLGAPDRD